MYHLLHILGKVIIGVERLLESGAEGTYLVYDAVSSVMIVVTRRVLDNVRLFEVTPGLKVPGGKLVRNLADDMT